MKKSNIFILSALILLLISACSLPSYELNILVEINPSQGVKVGDDVEIRVSVNFGLQKFKGWVYVNGNAIANGEEFKGTLVKTWKPSQPGNYEIYAKVSNGFQDFTSKKVKMRVFDNTAPNILELLPVPNYTFEESHGYLVPAGRNVFLVLEVEDPEATYLSLDWDLDEGKTHNVTLTKNKAAIELGTLALGDHTVSVVVKNPDGLITTGYVHLSVVNDTNPPTALITVESTYSEHGGLIYLTIDDDTQVSSYRYGIDDELTTVVGEPALTSFGIELGSDREAGSHKVDLYVEDRVGRFMYARAFANVVTEESSYSLLISITPSKWIYDANDSIKVTLTPLNPPTSVQYRIYMDGTLLPAATEYTWSNPTPGVHTIMGEMRLVEEEKSIYAATTVIIKDTTPPKLEKFSIKYGTNEYTSLFQAFNVPATEVTFELHFKDDNSRILTHGKPVLIFIDETTNEMIPALLELESVSNNNKEVTYKTSFDFSDYEGKSLKVRVYGIEDTFANTFEEEGKVTINQE